VIRTWFQKLPESELGMYDEEFQSDFVDDLATCTHPESVAIAIKEFCDDSRFCPTYIVPAAVKLSETLANNAGDQSSAWITGITNLLQSCYFLLDGDIVSDAFLQSQEHVDYIHRLAALSRHVSTDHLQLFRSMLVEVYLSMRRLKAIRREEQLTITRANHRLSAPGTVSITNTSANQESTRNSSLYTAALATLARNNLNVWELVLQNGNISGLKINSRNINVNSLQVSTESGGVTTLNLSVLIVPGRDILNVTNVSDSVSPAMERMIRETSPEVPGEGPQESNYGSGRNMRYMGL
jgi:hypothetical protein